MNLMYINEFRTTFKEISLYDGMIVPRLLARIADNQIILADTKAMKKTWIKTGLPDIASQLSLYLDNLKKSIKKSQRPKF